MRRRRWFHLIAATLLAAAAGAATAAPAAAAPDPGAAATAYLQARGAAVAAADPAAVLAPWLGREGRLASTEYFVARGTARRARQLGHDITSVVTRPVVLDSVVSADGVTALVRARVVTTTTWRAASGARSTEASGIDHTVKLLLVDGAWKVTVDTYSDVLVPSYLEAAGVPAPRVRGAARRVERVAALLPLPAADAARTSAGPRRYVDIVEYDREGCRDYADKYAITYNPTFVRFGADCANFASQCARAGDMPQAGSTYTSGWWYDKDGSSGPGDDTYSLSWINVPKQMSFWNGRRTDWATSISDVGKGDFIYYDWSGDGVWDHVAVLAGTNGAGQKVIDAHTTDHYRVYWKLGYSATRYKFARVRALWIIK
jgi:hypothetical protein